MSGSTSPVVGAGRRWLGGRWLIGPEIEKINEYVTSGTGISWKFVFVICCFMAL